MRVDMEEQVSCFRNWRVMFSVSAVILIAGTASAGKMIVRVEVSDYQTLYRYIPFKGSSITIAGALPGEWYDLEVDRSELSLVQNSGLPVRVMVDDVDTRMLELDEFGYYCSYDSLVRIMRNWAATYPNICKLESIGQTYENRWIYGVKITDNPSVEENEVEVLLESQHHAREWACAQCVRHFCDTLLRNYATNPDFQSFINNHVLWAFPVINVDGFVYDYPNQRSWRKDRQPFGGSIGCDPNRDYNGACNGSRMADWGALTSGSRSTHLPSDETFMGGYGAWANEIAALSSFFKQHTFVADVSLHSYSELVLWPYGNGETAPDNATLVSLGQRIAAQMSRLGGGTYTPEQASQLYPTSGGSIDWMYGWAKYVGGFPCMTYVFELGTAFYQNVSQLDAIQKECFDGLWYLYQRADSIATTLKGYVPRPILAPLDSSATGSFTVHWTPIRPAYNQPLKWELEQLTGLTVVTDDIESGTGKWVLQGASQSTTQKRSGTYSISLGTGNNVSNYAVTADPYPVQAGDSLKFWIWYNTENNYDVVVAEVSLEGKEWVQLHERFTGNSNGWVYRSYSLAPWVGRSVFIRFRYMTDDNTLGSGVFIDDVWPVPSFESRTVISDNIQDTLSQVTGREPGRYWYRVRGYNSLGWGDKGPLEDIVVTGSAVAESPLPSAAEGSLLVTPSIAAGLVRLSYVSNPNRPVELVVHDAAGRLVRRIVAGDRRGAGTVVWDRTDQSGRRVNDGVYYVQLSDNSNVMRRVVLMR
ncbi:MAG: M14 family zinc carboxypeptidase [candidate division WOR-3 bacterium]